MLIVLDTITNNSGSSSLLQSNSLAMDFPVPPVLALSFPLLHSCGNRKRDTNDTNLPKKWSREDRAVGCDPTVWL